MKKQLSEKEIDNLMLTLVCDAVADDETVNDIAASPTLWWGVQRQIASQKETRSPWPPANVIRRWLMITVPTAAAACLLLAFLFLRPVEQPPRTAVVDAPVTIGDVRPSVSPAPALDHRPDKALTGDKTRRTSRAIKVQKRKSENSDVRKPDEIKSEFIALSYAQNPESGQIVRVKVPSSMMVSLGLVSQVEKPASLVNAEVIVGDDGTTHAIRFIR